MLSHEASAVQSTVDAPHGYRDVEQVESDLEEDLSPDELDVPEQTMVDDLQKVEKFLFKTNAFQVMERELFDFVFPSFRFEMMRWISKERLSGKLSHKQLRDLEVIVSELQHIAPDQISLSLQNTPSLTNNIKGKWEEFTGETWDWGLLEPYVRPLVKGEARLHWICVSL